MKWKIPNVFSHSGWRWDHSGITGEYPLNGTGIADFQRIVLPTPHPDFLQQVQDRANQDSVVAAQRILSGYKWRRWMKILGIFHNIENY